MPVTRVEDRLSRRGGLIELLRVPAALFSCAVRVRGSLFDRGWMPIERLDVPVVSVGNLTVGGTGKTPAVALFARELLARGFKPGIASRGYRSEDGINDEARQLALELPGVPHEQNVDRAAAGRALEELGCDVCLLDDGFQHRRLARDLDIVLVDAARPWGVASGGPRAILPRGLLREAPVALQRAQAVVLTRTDQISEHELAALEDELERFAPGVPRMFAVHAPTRLSTIAGEELALERLKGADVHLASGIGHPEAFQKTLEMLGANVLSHARFPDHHAWSGADIAGPTPRITTRKDAVKIASAGHAPVCRTRTGRSAPSCSWGRPVSARLS